MATIRKRKKKDGSFSYQATVRVEGQPSLTETFDDAKSANHWAETMTVAARAAVHQLPNPKAYARILIGEAVDAFIQRPECTKTVKSNLLTVKAHIGTTNLGRLTKEFMQSYVERMRLAHSQYNRPFSNAAIAKQIGALRSLVRHFAELHRVDPPLAPITIALLGDDWDVKRDRRLKPSEEQLLRSEFNNRKFAEHWALLLDLALETASRQAEMILAETHEFNLGERVWIIPKEHTKARVARQVPLSKKAQASIQKLFDLLELHNQALRAEDANAPLETRLFYLFASPSSVCSGFRDITKILEIDNLHFHDLRHEATTRFVLYKRKLSVYEIMRIVGHSSLDMLNRYANLRGGDLADRMD